jgi:hypothetical protein
MTQLLLISWLIFAAIVVFVSLLIVLLLKKPMQQILSVNSFIQPAKVFYLRTFKIIIFLVALASVAETSMPKEDKTFMEYVWWITGSLQEPFFYLAVWTMLYAAMMTVLFVVLGRLRD